MKKNIAKANELLGCAYFFDGFVVRGNQIGRTIGFPTANLHINDEEKLIPSNGVYAVRVKGECFGEHILEGMMNIGVRPTVDGHKKVIEVNISDIPINIKRGTCHNMDMLDLCGISSHSTQSVVRVELPKSQI